MKRLIFLFTILFAIDAAAAAPNVVFKKFISIGNGGHSMACYNGDNLTFAEAFDIFEGRERGYTFPATIANPVRTSRELAAKIDLSLSSFTIPQVMRELSVSDKVSFVIQNMSFLRPGQSLTLSGDAYEDIRMNPGCTLIQTINFHSSARIRASPDAWDLLDNVSHTALYLHEGVYWHLRSGGVENDSRRTRKIVAHLMGGGELEPFGDVLEGASDVQYCHSVTERWAGDWSTQALAYRLPDGRKVLQFRQLGGYRMVTRTTLALPAAFGEKTGAVFGGSSSDQTAYKLNSIIDRDSAVITTWKDGKVTLRGIVQKGSNFRDQIRCEDVK